MPVPRDQFSCRSVVAFARVTYLDRTKNPEDQGLHNDESSSSDAECKVHSDVLANIRV
jgi:hypothetical protein